MRVGRRGAGRKGERERCVFLEKAKLLIDLRAKLRRGENERLRASCPGSA
jgi:hypothetical protein